MAASTVPLPENHKRYLSVMMFLLERSLDDVEGLLPMVAGARLTYDVTEPVDAKNARQIAEKIERARSVIKRMRDTFGLSRTEFNIARSIGAAMSSNWVMLVECKTKHIRGFGELPRETGEVLDPIVDELIETIRSIQERIPG